MDRQALVDRWQERQAPLNEALASQGPLDFRLDLDLGDLVWVQGDGLPRLRARVKVLCTWRPAESRAVMSWADESLDDGVTVGPFQDIPGDVQPCSESEAWVLAMMAGEQAGAQHLYRVPGPEETLFLGLWGLASVQAGGEFVPVAEEVLRILDGLSQTLWLRRGQGSAVGSHLREEGEALLVQARFVHPGSASEALLRSTGEALVGLGDSVAVPAGPLPVSEVRRLGTALADLRRAWEA